MDPPSKWIREKLSMLSSLILELSPRASPWNPSADLRAEQECVLPEVVWSALDCPGYFACMSENIRPALLGELHASLLEPVPGGEPLLVCAWPLGEDGRKLFAGTAVANASGKILAKARSTWIQVSLGGAA